MILSFIVAGSIVSSSINHMVNNYKKEEIEKVIPPFSTSVTLDEINDMNIIINDDDCSDTFFVEVTDKLKEDGISFTTTSNEVDINQNNVTVISLDQQYSAGPDTIIFAPYNNTRVGQSDSLALAMQSAFIQNGFSVSDISCGMAGYFEDNEGNVHYFAPTNTESAIDEVYDSSFVTISFGTQNINSEWVAKSIENGLARQNYYLKSEDNQSDLIYRANTQDDIDGVAAYFGTDSSSLRKYNNVGDTFTESEAVINPGVQDMKSFDKNGMFQIGKEKTRAY